MTMTIKAPGRVIRQLGIYKLIDNGNGDEYGDIWVDGFMEMGGYILEPQLLTSGVHVEEFEVHCDNLDEEIAIEHHAFDQNEIS